MDFLCTIYFSFISPYFSKYYPVIFLIKQAKNHLVNKYFQIPKIQQIKNKIYSKQDNII